ncbi:MAG TPA: hypothetical protein VHP33_26975 [Polyangiaceae bacterium]|nr:hypothetical protein [Polyangiaceae bacterium]
MAVSFVRASLASSRWWVLAAPAVLAISSFACSTDVGEEPNNSSAGAAGSGASQAGSGSTAAGSGSVLPGGGASATAGTGNVTAGTTSAAGTTATGGTTSTGGSAPTAGTTSTGGGNSVGMDTPPVRPLNINMAAAANKQITFTAKQLDPMAGSSTPDTNATAQQHGFVDTRKPKIQGKLVMTLGGIGTCCGQGGIGGFAVGLGFHEMAIAMQTKESSAPDEYKKVPEAMRTDEQNRQMGDARMEAWDGKDRVSWLNINEHDSFAYRAALGIKYMQEQDPGGDWEYFLNADGTVRWSDVYLVGYSYGSQTLAVVAKYVRIGRGIATSGPVDEGFPNATWIKATSATPLDRMIALIGSSNIDSKVTTTTSAGWLVPTVTVQAGATTADLMNGHVFILEGQGHSEMCAGDGGNWKALCQYAFGVAQ